MDTIAGITTLLFAKPDIRVCVANVHLQTEGGQSVRKSSRQQWTHASRRSIVVYKEPRGQRHVAEYLHNWYPSTAFHSSCITPSISRLAPNHVLAARRQAKVVVVRPQRVRESLAYFHWHLAAGLVNSYHRYHRSLPERRRCFS